MGFKCNHCGSNRCKKVNGVKVCADCGRNSYGAQANFGGAVEVQTDTSLDTNPAPQKAFPDFNYNSETVKKTIFTILGIFVVLFVISPLINTLISSIQPKPNYAFEVVEPFKLEYTGDEWQSSAKLRLKGSMKNVSNVSVNEAHIVLYIKNSVESKHYSRYVGDWKKDATLNLDLLFWIDKDLDMSEIEKIVISSHQENIYTLNGAEYIATL